MTITDMQTKESEKVMFERKDGILITSIPTKEVKSTLHYDVLLLIVLFGLSMVFAQKVMMATTNGTLAETPVEFSNGAAACVIAASKGYPEKYESGFEIEIDSDVADSVYVAGAKISDGKLLTAGGRVLGAVETADTLEKAIEGAYALTKKIHFENAYCRSDIGRRALAAREGK